jgi:rhodanese-related sulfurtransferase
MRDARTFFVPERIDRDGVQRLVAEGAQLVDVLSPEEYADAHIDGAINIPLKRLDRRSAGALDRAKPVITYCHDFQ